MTERERRLLEHVLDHAEDYNKRADRAKARGDGDYVWANEIAAQALWDVFYGLRALLEEP